MKAYYNIQQGTDEWHEIRYGKIGGTLAKGLFVDSSNLLDEILAAKSEDFELDFNGFISPDMQRGIELEPLAREKLSEYIGVSFKECGWMQCEENELLGISIDGISENETISCEIKCPAAKKHLQTIKENEIPLDNIAQCIHAFTVNSKLEKHYFCSFRPENRFKSLFVKCLTIDSLVNIGTKSKPNIIKVSEAVRIAKKSAELLLEDINIEIEKLKF
jgi:hypothetical protein